jgi:imidazolonepropionase-like amidohydrolase
MNKRLTGIALISSLVLLVAVPLNTHAQPSQTLALVGGMLLDGYESPPLHHAAVVIKDGKIVEVGRASDVNIPANATVIDTRGKTMLPGLIDLHVHLAILGHGSYPRWFKWIEENGGQEMTERVMSISARQLLMAGVTSAVDLGATLETSLHVRDRIENGQIKGPRLFVSGPWITRRMSVFPPAYQRQINTPDEAANETKNLAESGVNVIKAHSGLELADYHAIVKAAHGHNLPVHAHVYTPESVRAALDAGVDVLTHAGSAGTAPYEHELLQDIVNAGRPVVITAAHRPWIFPDTIAFPERLQDPQLELDFPPAIHAEVQDSFESFRTLAYFSTTPRQMRFRKPSLKQWIEGGAVMGMGTDSGTPMNFHTEALWREIKAHVDTGMSPLRAISAATQVNARILGRSSDLGTVEVGKLADVIVVEGDPLFDITALSRVTTVIKNGEIQKN